MARVKTYLRVSFAIELNIPDELMAELAKFKAGDEVNVCLPNTMYTSAISVEETGDGVGITGGDVEVCDDEGNEGELLSVVVK